MVIGGATVVGVAAAMVFDAKFVGVAGHARQDTYIADASDSRR